MDAMCLIVRRFLGLPLNERSEDALGERVWRLMLPREQSSTGGSVTDTILTFTDP